MLEGKDHEEDYKGPKTPSKVSLYGSHGIISPWTDSRSAHGIEAEWFDHSSALGWVHVTWEDQMVDKRSVVTKLSQLKDMVLEKPSICGRNLNQFMNAFFHLLDISSDYTYLTTVPVYDVVM